MTQYVINVGSLDLPLFREQRLTLCSLLAVFRNEDVTTEEQDSHLEGILNLLDQLADEVGDKYNERDHFLTEETRAEPLKGLEASIPERFYRGDCYPRAETVGDLLCLLSELPAALPIDGDFGRSIEVYATNVGQDDLTSALHITDTSTPNDALIDWECAKEEGNDFYTRENCAYCDGDCHVNWLLYGDEAEHLCDEYQADSDDRYERGT